jgi:hypothetical protein
MRLLLERDDAAMRGEDRQYAAPGAVDRGAAAVQQHERHAASTSVDLVIEADAPDLRSLRVGERRDCEKGEQH